MGLSIYIVTHSTHSVQFSHANPNTQVKDLWSVHPLWSIQSLIKGTIFLQYCIYHFTLKKLCLSSIYINQVALIFQFGKTMYSDFRNSEEENVKKRE